MVIYNLIYIYIYIHIHYKAQYWHRKEGNVLLRRTQYILFTVIWHQTYG